MPDHGTRSVPRNLVSSHASLCYLDHLLIHETWPTDEDTFDPTAPGGDGSGQDPATIDAEIHALHDKLHQLADRRELAAIHNATPSTSDEEYNAQLLDIQTQILDLHRERQSAAATFTP